MTDDRMFDPDQYRSSADRDSGQRRKARQRGIQSPDADGSVLTLDDQWHVITTTAGPIPFVHRLDYGIATRNASLGHTISESSVATLCDQVGRLLYTCPPGTRVWLCVECNRRRPNRIPTGA